MEEIEGNTEKLKLSYCFNLYISVVIYFKYSHEFYEALNINNIENIF